jgi:hypothetical protein
MKDDMVWVIGGAVLLYLIVNNQGVSAAQAQINQTNLQARTDAANASLIGNTAMALGNDIAAIGGAW